MKSQKDNDQEIQLMNLKVIHSGFTNFPVVRHVLTLIILAILEAEGIYICVPFNRNASVSFLIGQVALLAVIIYSWLHILDIVPGPMSELFKQDILKRAIEEGLYLKEDKPKGQQKICTNCQIQRATKTYHCQYCNRSVYKSYFHSQWLNTCISKENFPSFIAFLIFLFGYLILLAVNNFVFFNRIWDEDAVDFATFFVANAENAIVSIFLFGLTFLIFIVGVMIVITYYFACRTRQSVAPVSCSANCQGLKGKITSNDKILHRIRNSIRQSPFIHLRSSASKKNHNFFKETQAVNPLDLIFKAFEKANIQKLQNEPQNNAQYPTEDTKKQLFANLFAAIMNLTKDKNESQKPKEEKDLKLFQAGGQMTMQKNMTKSKWKKYMKSTFKKGPNIRREPSLAEAVQDKNLSSRNESEREIDKGSDSQRQFVMKKSSFKSRRLPSIISQKLNEEKQHIINSPTKQMFKFTKKLPHLEAKLYDINEKSSNLEDQTYSKKSHKQKKQNEQESMQGLY